MKTSQKPTARQIAAEIARLAASGAKPPARLTPKQRSKAVEAKARTICAAAGRVC